MELYDSVSLNWLRVPPPKWKVKFVKTFVSKVKGAPCWWMSWRANHGQECPFQDWNSGRKDQSATPASLDTGFLSADSCKFICASFLKEPARII